MCPVLSVTYVSGWTGLEKCDLKPLVINSIDLSFGVITYPCVVTGSQPPGISDSMIPAYVNQNTVVFVINLIVAAGVFGKNCGGNVFRAKADIFKGAIFNADSGVG